jgi:hypothetical protein
MLTSDLSLSEKSLHNQCSGITSSYQDLYRCFTCSMANVCQCCVRTCHKHHHVLFVGFQSSFCICQFSGNCKCLENVDNNAMVLDVDSLVRLENSIKLISPNPSVLAFSEMSCSFVGEEPSKIVIFPHL